MMDIKYWVALSQVARLGTVKFRKLEACIGSLERAWHASASDLKFAGMDDRVIREIVAVRARTSPDLEMERLGRAGVQAVNWHNETYPSRLKEIADPPAVLYYKGTLLPSDERSVAVVGTRGPTSYGREVASALTQDLARNGIAVVSGLARGVDSVAHRVALEGGARTVAVLANGLHTIYPPEHANLAQQITENGAVVSEYPLGVRPEARNFPRRNRLISGMTLGTLVVEAGEGSGARWTVYHALEQNREVFCVPGSIFSPMSKLTNRLIQDGAKLVSSVEDILEELNLTTVAYQPPLPMPPLPMPEMPEDDDELSLLRHLNEEPLHIDDIRRTANIPIAAASSMLAILEIKGLIQQVGCMHYVRVREVSQVYGN
jgi:DNA processing protein